IHLPVRRATAHTSVVSQRSIYYLFYLRHIYLIYLQAMWVKSLIFLFAISALAQAEDTWSWDADTNSDTAADASSAVPVEEVSTASAAAPADAQGRFFGIGDKLCRLGLGVHCNNKKPYKPNVQSHYQVKPHLPQRQYPNPAYNTPKPAYQAPYDLIKTQYVAPQTQYLHSHTHIHKTPGASTAPAYVSPLYKPAYREQCECVVAQYCQGQDIISRRDSKDISHLLDARSEFKEGFQSNATSFQGRSNFKEGTPESIATTEYEVERTKRETLTPGQNRTYNIEGRQFTSYIPTHIGCGIGHICCRNPVYIPPTPKYTCGRSSSSGLLGRVKTPQYIQGDAEFAEYPWQAAILKTAGQETIYVCGAALIDEKHLLTAAHCVDGLNPYNLRVRLGEWDVTQSTEFFSHVELQVANVIEHQDFYKGNLKNDIAILRLASHVDFNSNPHISPVCLPDQYSNFHHQQCVVTGWGKDSFGTDGKFQTVLKEVSVPVVDYNRCQNTMRQTRLGRSFNLDPGMLCAGGEEAKDACQGDGGSPLVCRRQDGSYQLAGLVSWGIGCGQRGIPGVYVNINNYLQWIKYNTGH
ncbi:unnamed protein product, partial [Meganyctiphanes norvegica]